LCKRYLFKASLNLFLSDKNNLQESDYKIKWITQGIKLWSQKIRFLNNLKKNSNLSSAALDYIKTHHKIYIRVVIEAKIWEYGKIKQECCGI